jgi:hypothetical protein
MKAKAAWMRNVIVVLEEGMTESLLTYLQFSVIKWAKQRPSQNPFDVKSDEAIQI